MITDPFSKLSPVKHSISLWFSKNIYKFLNGLLFLKSCNFLITDFIFRICFSRFPTGSGGFVFSDSFLDEYNDNILLLDR